MLHYFNKNQLKIKLIISQVHLPENSYFTTKLVVTGKEIMHNGILLNNKMYKIKILAYPVIIVVVRKLKLILRESRSKFITKVVVSNISAPLYD